MDSMTAAGPDSHQNDPPPVDEPRKNTYPDGPRIHLPLALISQMLPALFPFDALEFGLGIVRQFGDIAHYQLGPLHVYQLSHPDLARQVLVEQAEKFHKPKLIKRAFRPFAGEGLLTSDGAAWRHQRKLLQPAFHHRQLAAYSEVMVEQAMRLVESFREGETRDIGSEMARVTMGVVVNTLFGADLPREIRGISGSMRSVLDAANRRMNSVLQIPSWAPTPRNLRERRALAGLDAMFRLIIQMRRRSAGRRDDLLSALLAAADEDSAALSDQQLRDEMMTLFLAGHETTANTLTWTWYLLSQHPEVEAKLLRELRSVVGGRSPALTDLPNLPYTEMVIREAMRLFPPAPGVAREPIEDVTIAGYRVRRGSLISVNTYAMHRDARFFADPQRFDPERFSSGWEERTPRYAYLPFGGGPRICIGNAFAMMEARLILATVALRYQLSLEGSAAEVVPVQLVTLRPKRPVRMRLTRRPL
jgi:cytochrome P450